MTVEALLDIMNNFPNHMIIHFHDFEGNYCSGHKAEVRNGQVRLTPFDWGCDSKMTVGTLCDVLETLDGGDYVMIPSHGGGFSLASKVEIFQMYILGGGYEDEICIA